MASPEELQILLKAVGAKDTETALKNISNLLRKAGEDAKGTAPGAKAAKAAFEELESKGKDLAQSLGPAGSVLSALGPAGLAAAAGIGATVGATLLAANTLREWTQSMLDTVGALTDQRDETGISLKALQEYNYVAAAAGITQGELVAALRSASRVIAEGGESAEKAAAKLGIPFDKLRAMNPDQQLMAIKTALDGVSSSAEKAAILKDIGFRDPGILRVMAQDVSGLRKEFNDLGLSVRDDVVERFDAMGDELGKLGVVTDAFKLSIVQMVFGNADAGQSIKDLAALVAEAGAAAREAAPLFSDLFTVITGADLTTQIERFRFLIAAARSVAQFVKSGGKEFSFNAPTQSIAPQKPNALSDVKRKPGPTESELRAAEERAKRLKELMDQLSGSSARQALNDLALTVTKLGGVGGVAAGEYQRLKEQVQELGKSAPVPDILKPLLVTAEEFGPTLDELGINFDVLETRDLSGLSGQLKASADATGGLVTATRDEILAARDADRAAQGHASAIEFVAKQMLATGELTQAEYDKIISKTDEAKNASVDWSGALNDLRNAFEVLGLSANSVLAQMLSGFTAGIAAAQRVSAILKQAKEQGRGLTTGEKLAVGQGGLQTAIGAYQSGSVLGGAAAGAAFGSAFGPIGTAIGGVAGGILGLFGGKAKIKKELADLRAQLLQSVGGSMEELRKKAASLGVDISKAFSTKDPKELKRIMDELNKAAEEQKKRWEGVQTAVAGLTLRVKGFAAELVKSLGIDGVNTFDDLRQKIADGTLAMEGLGEATDRQQRTFDRMGLFAVATFAQYIRESGDVIGALREMDAALGDLTTAQEAFGFAGSEAINQLLGLRDVVNANSDVADSIQGLNQIMQGLSAAGLNNAEIFNAFGTDAVELFTQMTEGGASANQAMALMQPTLQKLWEHQKKYGDITDEATLALLQEAEAQGLVGESMKEINEQILDVLVAIADVLGAKIPQGLQRMGDAAERQFGRFGNAASGAGNQIPTNFPGEGGAGTGGGSGGPDAGGFTIGGTVNAPLSGKTITVHGTEHIFRPEQLTAVVGAAVERGYQAAVAQFSGSRQTGDGESVIVLDGERVGRTMRRRAETGRDTPRRGPMAPRRWR